MNKVTRRGFAGGGVVAAAIMSAPAMAAALAKPATLRDPLEYVDPELRPAARQMKAMTANFPPFTRATLPAARAMNFAREPLSTIPFEKRSVPSQRGPAVTIYVINGRSGEHRPGILHMHGGGFVTGSASSQIRDLQEIASTLGCTIVTVDYRLAPETPWTGSLEDNYAALTWLHRRGSEVGVDPSRIAVMGESAGGGHAALLAITARDRGEVPLVFQCLTYPMLDDRTGSTRRVAAPRGSVGWDEAANRFGWSSFLGRAAGNAGGSHNGVPARTVSVEGLPPAWIGVGGIDLFVEEDIDFARRLIVADVPTELLVVPGAFHGFELIAGDTKIAQSFKSARIEALRRALKIPSR